MKKFVLFHADDFSFSPGVTRGIMDAIGQGVVRSTSVMINLPGSEESIRMLAARNIRDIGLHVNLTFGSPVSHPAAVPSLVGPDGRFLHRPDLIPSVSAEDLKTEILAQFEKARRTGVHLTHLDSHHHVHTLNPHIMDLFLDLASEYRLAVRAVDAPLRELCRKRGISAVDTFIGTFFGEKRITLEHLLESIDQAEGRTIEVMCHPGYVDEFLQSQSSYVEPREREILLLTGLELRNKLHEMAVELIDYTTLMELDGERVCG